MHRTQKKEEAAKSDRRIYRSISFSFRCCLWRALHSDGAFNDEHTGTGEADIRAEFHDQLLKQRQTSMSRDVMACVDKHSQDVDGQFANRRIAT